MSPALGESWSVSANHPSEPPVGAGMWGGYVPAWTHGINTNISLCRKRNTRVEKGGGIEESVGEIECVCVHDSVSICENKRTDVVHGRHHRERDASP